MKVDGTSAKNIAIHFLDRTTERYTPAMVAKTIVQSKSILKSGYTEEEIIEVIDYLIDVVGVNMYSIGYVSHAINNVLADINREKNKKIIEEQRKEIEKMSSEMQSNKEVVDDKSKQRNKRKLDRFGNESRVGKKPYSDLFE